jgi:hypothetical protein
MRSGKYEQFLRRHGLGFVFKETVPITEIDEEASLKNNARFVSINPEIVNNYALKMIDGVDFEAICVHKPKNAKKYVIISGNHRFQAHKVAEHTEIDLYFVTGELPDAILLSLIYESNMLESEQYPPVAERYAGAMVLYQRGVYSLPVAANVMNVKYSTLENQLNALEAKNKLLKMEFKNANKLTQTELTLLSRIHQDKPLFKAAGLCYEARLTQSELTSLVNDVVAKQSSEKKQSDVINKAYSDNIDRLGIDPDGKRKSVKVTPRQKFNKALDSIIYDGRKHDALAPFDLAFIRKINRVIKVLSEVVRDADTSKS